MKSFLLLIVFSLLVINCTFSQITCNNWLKLANSPDGVTIGDLDMTGNKLTVEALFNRTQPYSGSASFAGDIVSKHLDPIDCNYLLRPGHAEITTSKGFFATPENCEIKLNKTYHVAMVYDGSTLKFYRNGYLMGQVNASGNLVTNDWLTKIGETASPRNTYSTELKGFINEVRIWNVARTQQEIRATMDSSLPNPATQAGLVAYYTFDNLLNKQGNTAWNGSINGAAVINATNTNCAFVADSCEEIGAGGGNNCSVNAGKDVTICAPGQVQLNANGAVSYIWSPSAGLSDAYISNPVATISSTTTYIVTGKTANGCVAKDTITISLASNPTVKASNDTTICAGINSAEVVQLTATGAQTFSWSPSVGLSNTDIANPLATVSAHTTYIVTGTALSGCSAKDTVVINVLSKPIISLTNDTLICKSGSVQLLASGGQSYQWYPGTYLNNTSIPNPVAIPLESTKYFVTATSENNCSSRDSINVAVKTAGTFDVTPKNATLCSDTSIQLTASGGDAYQWQPSNNLSDPAIANPIAKPDTTTVYNVSIKDSFCNYDTTLSVSITIKPTPKILVSKDGDFSCNKPTVQLNASGGSTYFWTPSSGLSNSKIPNPIATVPSNTTFYVSASSADGCITKDSIHINFISNATPQIPILPTAFTPNRDGLNDCFGVPRSGNANLTSFTIFNRWGEVVFKGNSSAKCWDGTFNNKKQPTGAYPYIIKIKTACGEVEKRGIVVLIL